MWSLLHLLTIGLIDGFFHAHSTWEVIFTYLHLIFEAFLVESVCIIHILIIQNQIKGTFAFWSFLTTLSVICAETSGQHLLFLGWVASHYSILWDDLLLRGLNLHLLFLVLLHFFLDFFTCSLVLKSEQTHFLFLKSLIVFINDFWNYKKILADGKIPRLLLDPM